MQVVSERQRANNQAQCRDRDATEPCEGAA
jgi:hypothetical protein